MLSGRYWPCHPKPLPSELFSSWLIRLASKNSTRLHTFFHLEWPHKQIWTRDIDKFQDNEFISKLAEKSGASIEALDKMSLRSYNGLVYEKTNHLGHSGFIRPIGIRHRTRNRVGLMWCPECLATDNVPYYRKEWRTLLSPTCPRHGIVLADQCHECETPCMPHRGDFLSCYECKTPHSRHPSVPAKSRALQLSFDNLRVVKTGITSIGFHSPMHSIVYFDIIRQLIKIVCSGARSENLRHILFRQYNTDPSPFEIKSGEPIESLSAKELHRAFEMISYLLAGWPFMFVGLCAEADVWFSWATKDMPSLRFEYYSIARRFLSATC